MSNSTIFGRIVKELKALCDESGSADDFVMRAVPLVLQHDDVVRAAVTYLVRDYYEDRKFRGHVDSPVVGTRAAVWRDQGAPRTEEEAEALVAHAVGLMDMPLEHGRKIGEYLPVDLDKYGDRELRAGQTRVVRGRFYKAVAQRCTDASKTVRQQLTEQVLRRIRATVINAHPERDRAREALHVA